MNKTRWSLTGASLAMVAVIAGVCYAWVTQGEAEGSPSASIVVNSPADGLRALQTVSDTVGFQADVPSFFPTSATRLVVVDSGTGPGSKVGGSLPLIEQLYQSDRKMTFKGREFPSTIELFQILAHLNSAQGEKLAISNASYDIYRHVVDQDEAGVPIKVTYTAIGGTKSFVIDFSGEQPSDEGIVKMLESMKPVPKTP